MKIIALLERLGFYTKIGSILIPIISLILQTVPPMYSYITGEITGEIMVPSGKKYFKITNIKSLILII